MLSVESSVLSGQPPLPIGFETQEVSRSAARKTDTMFFIFFIANGEHVHPLPATAEDELGVIFRTTINVANTAAGSGLHDADCWLSGFHVRRLRIACQLDTHDASRNSIRSAAIVGPSGYRYP